MAILVALFIVAPLVELWGLLTVGGLIGFWPTVAISLATAVLGAALAKREGRRVLGAWSDAMKLGLAPDEGVASGILVLLGGILLVVPGFLSDLVGLALLFPPTRRLVAAIVSARVAARMAKGPAASASSSWNVRVVSFASPPSARRGESVGPQTNRDVIDVEGEVVEEQVRRLLP